MSSTATDDLYAVLGIAEDANDDEIRRSYKKLAKELHPDRFVGDPAAQQAAQEKFARVSHSYNVLKDQTARSEYDFERKMLQQRGLDEAIEVVEVPVEETGYKREMGDRKFKAALRFQSEGDLDRAISALKEAVELCPNVAQYHSLLAALYDKRGWHSYAKAEVEIAIRLSPKDPYTQKLHKKLIGQMAPKTGAKESDRGSKAKKGKKGKTPKPKGTGRTAPLKGTQGFRKKRSSFWSALLNRLFRRSAQED